MDYKRSGPKFGRKRWHVLVAEKAIGRELPKGSVVHHADGDKFNNDPSNLVILQNQSEHSLVHVKKTILDHGGDWQTERYCRTCDTVKVKDEFGPDKRTFDGRQERCRECVRAYKRAARTAA
jgi:hypothetical protein